MASATVFVRHGYLVAVQDCRGRFGSEGRFFPFVDEPEDGYDAVQWLAAHPRRDGQVGMYGGSHLAWVQFHAATQAPLAARRDILVFTIWADASIRDGHVPGLGASSRFPLLSRALQEKSISLPDPFVPWRGDRRIPRFWGRTESWLSEPELFRHGDEGGGTTL